jgi:hypothetical protein
MRTVAPLPVRGRVLPDRRDGRAVRVSWHPEIGAVVLSVWKDGTCTATAQLDAEAAAGLVAALADSLASAAVEPSGDQPVGDGGGRRQQRPA